MACARMAFTNPEDLTGTRLPELSGLDADPFEPQVRPQYIFEDIVGKSPALQKVLKQVAIVARTDATVLLYGESGTGKELIARAIHNLSSRRKRTLVSVNCGAIPSGLLESELFGHERGAFTGAVMQKKGRFELADKGTLFLDEIGDIPLELQPKLLRALQEQEIERLGSAHTIHVNVRIIAATHRNLAGMIGEGTFREDLYYRLNVFPIGIPPLRERKADIPLLVDYFIDRYARKAGKNIESVDEKTLQLFQSYPWPGNIRELQNVIERSVILCETATFSVDERWLSEEPVKKSATSQLYLSEKVAAQEKEIIEAALHECRGRVSGPSGAADRLGIARSTLESKIRSLTINKNYFRTCPGT